MNNFITLASNYIYKIVAKNANQEDSKDKSISTKISSVKYSKPELRLVKAPGNNFTIFQKKIFMSDSIRKAEEFAKKQSVCYCYKHSNLFIKPSWCYKCNKKCNKKCNIINNPLHTALALNGSLNNIDYAVLGLIGVGCISYIFYWKR